MPVLALEPYGDRVVDSADPNDHPIQRPGFVKQNLFRKRCLATGKYDQACALYEQLKASDSTMFAAWYGIGECNANDNIVIQDANGWRFRSSYRRALEAYQAGCGVGRRERRQEGRARQNQS